MGAINSLASRVAAHLALAEKAAPRPWRGSTWSVYCGKTGAVLADVHSGTQYPHTAPFIAASHDACAIIREQAAEIQRLRMVMQSLVDAAESMRALAITSIAPLTAKHYESSVQAARAGLEQQP